MFAVNAGGPKRLAGRPPAGPYTLLRGKGCMLGALETSGQSFGDGPDTQVAYTAAGATTVLLLRCAAVEALALPGGSLH